jgi:hypothetical protein
METVRGAQPCDLIALAWYSIGFRPDDSLILIALHQGVAGRGPVLRVPMPPRSGEPPVAAALFAMLRGADPDADGVVALVMQPELRSARLRRLIGQLRRQARAHGLDLLDVLSVGPHRYRSALCSDFRCCPANGRPVSEVQHSTVATMHVAAGDALAESEAALLADVVPEAAHPPDAAGPARSGSAPEPEPESELEPGGSAEAKPGTEPPEAGPSAGISPQARLEVLAGWRRLLASTADQVPDSTSGLAERDRPAGLHQPRSPRPEPPAPAELPALAASLRDPELRDAIMVSLVPGTGELPEALLSGKQVDLGAVLRAVPDGELTRRGEEALAVLARAAARADRAHPVATLALLSWWSGHGTRARLLADHALQLDPDHALAGLVQEMLAAVLCPPWVAAAKLAAG